MQVSPLQSHTTIDLQYLSALSTSLHQVIQKDDPATLRSYLNEDQRRLEETDQEKNSLLMLLLMGKATKAALALVLEYHDAIDFKHKNMQKKSALHYASSLQGAQEVIRQLLLHDANVLDVDCFGNTPLHTAIANHNLEAVRLIINVSNNPPALLQALFEDHHTTPLHLAAKSTFQMLETVATLTNNFNAIDEDGKTALHHALTGLDPFNNAQYLLIHSADINRLDAREMSPLAVACSTLNVALVDLLLASGADPNLGSPPPLAIAYASGSSLIAKRLIANCANPNLLLENQRLYDICLALDDREFLNVLPAPAPTQTSEMVGRCKLKQLPMQVRRNPPAGPPQHHLAFADTLVFEQKKKSIKLENWEVKNSEGKTALLCVCEKGTVAQVHRLLELNVDHETRDAEGNSILHAAILAKNSLVFCYLIRHFKGFIQQQNRKGLTPLHLAVLMGNALAIKLLLQYGANPNAQDSQKNGPLHLVAYMKYSHASSLFQAIDLLLSKGASLELANEKLQTPVMIAFELKHTIVLRYLLKRGANPNSFNWEKKNMLIRCCEIGNHTLAQELISLGANQNAKGQTTPLIAACKIKSLGLVTLLLNPAASSSRVTADPNKTAGTDCPLGVTLEQMFSNQAGAMEIVNQLVAHGVDVDKRVVIRSKKVTPLFFALENSIQNLALLFINHGADPEKKNEDKVRPIELAAKKGLHLIVEALLRAGAKVPKSLSQCTTLTRQVNEVLRNYKQSPRIVPRFKRTKSWDDLRREISQSNDSPHSTSSSSPGGSPHSPNPVLLVSNKMQSLSLVDKNAQALNRINSLEDCRMRQAGMIASQPLLFQKSRVLPSSMCRLSNTMSISIQGKSVIDKTSKFASEGRDERAREIVSTLLNPIHERLRMRMEPEQFQRKVALLTKMDHIDETAITSLDIFQNGIFQPQNRDVIPLKLISKEGSCLAIVPVWLQVRLYSEKHSNKVEMRSNPIRDQWEEIDVSLEKEGFVGTGKTSIRIDAKRKKEENLTFAATVEVRAKMAVDDLSGYIFVTLQRTNLQFTPGLHEKLKEHIFKALNSDITYDTRI